MYLVTLFSLYEAVGVMNVARFSAIHYSGYSVECPPKNCIAPEGKNGRTILGSCAY